MGFIIPLSSLYTIGKTAWEALKLAGQEQFLDARLNEFANPISFFEGINDPFELFLARSRILLAEYRAWREDLRESGDLRKIYLLWGKVKKKMDENLSNVEKKLKEQTANLYHVAVLSSGLAKVAGEAENELAALAGRIKEKETEIEALGREFRSVLAEIEVLKTDAEEKRKVLAGNERSLADFEHRLQKLSENLDLLRKGLDVLQNRELSVLKLQMETRLNRLQNAVDSELAAQKDQLGELCNSLGRLEEMTERLEETVALQARNTEDLFKEQKAIFSAQVEALKTEVEEKLRDYSLVLGAVNEQIAFMKRGFFAALAAAALFYGLLAAVLFMR